jgi:gliding motility-associated-like protein
VGESLTLYPFIDPTRLASWSWIPVNGITNPNQLAQTITPKAPTTYYIQGTTLDSCYVLDSLTITPRYDVFANAGLDKAICINDSITLTATGGLRYVWNTGDTTATIRVAPTDTIQYWVVAYKGLCESRADTINIFVNDILPDFKANLDTGYAPQIVRFTNLSLGANTYLWDFGNGITTNDVNPSYLYKKTGKYSVTLYAINDRTGCIDSITRIIVIDTVTLNVPNIITINNDNLNDDFRIFTVNMREVVIDIYNRWGELIYTTTDLNARWNAIVREKRVPNGTYVVIINGIGKNDQPYRYIGTLSVVK